MLLCHRRHNKKACKSDPSIPCVQTFWLTQDRCWICANHCNFGHIHHLSHEQSQPNKRNLETFQFHLLYIPEQKSMSNLRFSGSPKKKWFNMKYSFEQKSPHSSTSKPHKCAIFSVKNSYGNGSRPCSSSWFILNSFSQELPPPPTLSLPLQDFWENDDILPKESCLHINGSKVWPCM